MRGIFEFCEIIKDISVSLSPLTVRNSRLISKADVIIIYENESSSLASMSSTAEISLDSSDRENAIAALNIKSVDYTIASSKHLDMRLNSDLSAFLYDSAQISVLSDIEQGEEIKAPSSLTLYFAKENESVWDIAKSFSSDSDLIMSENALNEEKLDSDKIILIPRV